MVVGRHPFPFGMEKFQRASALQDFMEGFFQVNPMRNAASGTDLRHEKSRWSKQVPGCLDANTTRWWFQRFIIFTPTWGNDPI